MPEEENKTENQPETQEQEISEQPKETKDSSFLLELASDILTAVAITLVAGLIGFGGLGVYSTMSYRAQIAEAQAQSSAANAPALSGYAYAGPNGTHRPDSWPAATAQASSRIERVDGGTAAQAAPEEKSSDAESNPISDPETGPEAGPEQSQSTPTVTADTANSETTASNSTSTNSQPSESAIASSGDGGPVGNVSNADSGSNSQSATYTHDFSGGKLLGTIQSNKYHNKDCVGAQKIPPENEIWFDSIADAEANGYEPCGICYR